LVTRLAVLQYRTATRAAWYVLALFLTLSLTGCLLATRISAYPEGWAPAATAPANQCPAIAGRYVNSGIATGEHLGSLCPRDKYARKAGWNCDAQLAGNLIKMRTTEWSEIRQARAVEWLVIEQPDADTLEMHFPPASRHEPIVLKRGKGDFQCDGSSLRFSMIGSVLAAEERSDAGNVTVTTLSLMVFSGGVVSTDRVFRPLQDGALTMEVTESVAVTHGFFLAAKYSAFVRWERSAAWE
jgi:hypothetical protein